MERGGETGAKGQKRWTAGPEGEPEEAVLVGFAEALV
jgi:hypothetical protein